MIRLEIWKIDVQTPLSVRSRAACRFFQKFALYMCFLFDGARA